MNAPVMVELEGETDPLEVIEPFLLSLLLNTFILVILLLLITHSGCIVVEFPNICICPSFEIKKIFNLEAR